jgi:cytochrome c peroxidase
MTRLVAIGIVLAACTGNVAPVPDGPVDAPDADASASRLRIPDLGPVPPIPSDADDPATPAKIALGTTLFFDARLSGSGRTRCASCHVPRTFYQDNLPLSTPDRSFPNDSPAVTRNATSLFNLAYAPVFRWAGSHTDIVEVMAFPLAEPNMNIARLAAGDPANDVPAAQRALRERFATDLRGYVPLFREAFGVELDALDAPGAWRVVGRALRAFVAQSVVSRDAAFDRWNAGDDAAMSASAVRGLEVFRGRGRCVACHRGPMFTDFAFHNLSTTTPRADGTYPDEGRVEVTGRPADRGAFLTPTLRSAYDTSPYFHDGRTLNLRAVLEFLRSPAVSADPNHDAIFDTPLSLSDDDVTDLIAFLRALRGTPVAPAASPAVFP